MPTDVPYAEYDAFFLLYNRVRRELDGKLKKERLTLSGLQILTLIHQAQARGSVVHRSSIAATIGLTESTLSTTIKGLKEKGFLSVDKTFKSQPLRIEIKGMKAMDAGLAARAEVLKSLDVLLPAESRSAFFDALNAANKSIDAKAIAERKAKYLKSVNRDTRDIVRGKN